jgi:BirA family biotin operon repressor/biotin-[acetyl-CoA-carboxylase] ligase
MLILLNQAGSEGPTELPNPASVSANDENPAISPFGLTVDFGEHFCYHQDAMQAADIVPRLSTRTFGRTLFPHEILDSTNARAKALAMEGVSHGAVVIAESQSAGRGRLGRAWQSEPGSNLTFSVILRPTISPDRLGLLSLYASLAVAKGVEAVTGLKPTCKWPNDLLLASKKFCGILSEAVLSGPDVSSVVVGIGINVNQAAFQEELAGRATSLCLAAGGPIDRFGLLAEVLLRLEEEYDAVQRGDFGNIVREWKARTSLFGSEVSVDRQGTLLRGTASRLADDGGLIISTNGEEIKLLSGDVTVIS